MRITFNELFQTLHFSQLRYDHYEAAVEAIKSQGRVDEMPDKPATQIPLFLLRPLIIGKEDKG